MGSGCARLGDCPSLRNNHLDHLAEEIMVVIKCAGFANGMKCSVLHQYLESYNPDGDARKPLSVWTKNVWRARRFADAGEAFECWRQVRKSDPVREDGQPNRPLTAFSIEVLPAPTDRH